MEYESFDIALLVTFCHGAVELVVDIEEDEKKRLQQRLFLHGHGVIGGAILYQHVKCQMSTYLQLFHPSPGAN